MNYSKLIVNLKTIKENLCNLKRKQYEDTGIIAVVKADSYGLGSKEVCSYLEAENLVKYFAVAYFSEAKELVDNGIKTPIILLMASTQSVIDDLIGYNSIYPSVSNYKFAEMLDKKCRRLEVKKKIHIEVNTGMNRSGINYDEAFETIKKISKLENIIIDGIFTHFSSADFDIEYTYSQKDRFDEILDKLAEEGISIPNKHVCNSAATTYLKDERYNLIRPGIMMYGYYPSESIKELCDIKPACKLISHIAHINTINVADKVGYSQQYVADKKTKVATINIGYADGLPRILTAKGKVMIRNVICDIIGIICMDSCMVDVTELDEVKVGDEVVIFDDKNITVEEIAKKCKTINYEILTGIGNRVKREYMV